MLGILSSGACAPVFKDPGPRTPEAPHAPYSGGLAVPVLLPSERLAGLCPGRCQCSLGTDREPVPLRVLGLLLPALSLGLLEGGWVGLQEPSGGPWFCAHVAVDTALWVCL